MGKQVIVRYRIHIKYYTENSWTDVDFPIPKDWKLVDKSKSMCQNPERNWTIVGMAKISDVRKIVEELDAQCKTMGISYTIKFERDKYYTDIFNTLSNDIGE